MITSRPIARAIAGRLDVFLDGGIRRGTDVVKALALGARGVLVGRPVLWAVASTRDGDIFCIVSPKVGAYSIVFVVLLMLTLLGLVWT